MRSKGWLDFYVGNRGRLPRTPFSDALTLFEERCAAPGLAADIGAGDGVEAKVLLSRGWRVVAIDGEPEFPAFVRAGLSDDEASRIDFQIAAFESMQLPTVDFVWAGLSLFFCTPASFDSVWRSIAGAIRVGGCFAGHFMGPNDSWANGMPVHTADEVRHLLADFEIVVFDESDRDGSSASGPKHWHIFDVVAFKTHQRTRGLDSGQERRS